MRDFLRAFGESWITAMSGIASVAFWAISAVFEGMNYPVSVRIAFIVAAAFSMYYASYRVWKHATNAAVQRIAAFEAEIADLRVQLSRKEDGLAERDRRIEEERAAHQTELHRAKTSDPKKNAIRSEIEKLIRQLEEMKRA